MRLSGALLLRQPVRVTADPGGADGRRRQEMPATAIRVAPADSGHRELVLGRGKWDGTLGGGRGPDGTEFREPYWTRNATVPRGAGKINARG